MFHTMSHFIKQLITSKDMQDYKLSYDIKKNNILIGFAATIIVILFARKKNVGIS